MLPHQFHSSKLHTLAIIISINCLKYTCTAYCIYMCNTCFTCTFPVDAEVMPQLFTANKFDGPEMIMTGL